MKLRLPTSKRYELYTCDTVFKFCTVVYLIFRSYGKLSFLRPGWTIRKMQERWTTMQLLTHQRQVEVQEEPKMPNKQPLHQSPHLLHHRKQSKPLRPSNLRSNQFSPNKMFIPAPRTEYLISHSEPANRLRPSR